MTYYLVQLATTPDTTISLVANARRNAARIRRATDNLDGELESCWFTRDGERIVAIAAFAHEIDGTEFEREVNKVIPGLRVELTPVMTLREIFDSTVDERLGEALGELTDPVDLASALSFPASDPPSWRTGDIIAPTGGA